MGRPPCNPAATDETRRRGLEKMLAQKAWRVATRKAVSIQAARTAALEIKRVAKNLERATRESGLEEDMPAPRRGPGRPAHRVTLAAPERTEEEMREAAMRLVNSELWDLEKKAEIRPLTLDENKRLKDLVVTLNQSQNTGRPTKKNPGEMTDEELEQAAKGG